MCLSYRTLRTMKTLPRAAVPWVLDSGGFTELSKHGKWTWSVREYADNARRYQDEIGQLQWAAQMDWMCEDQIVEKTGKSVREHLWRTIENYFELRHLAPEVRWMPCLQGFRRDDYYECWEAYVASGVKLSEQPIVGLGSVCCRKDEDICNVFPVMHDLHARGVKVHAFGLVASAIDVAMQYLASSDSMSWSFTERKQKTGRQNSLEAALEWRDEKVAPLLEDPLAFHKRDEEKRRRDAADREELQRLRRAQRQIRQEEAKAAREANKRARSAA